MKNRFTEADRDGSLDSLDELEGHTTRAVCRFELLLEIQGFELSDVRCFKCSFLFRLLRRTRSGETFFHARLTHRGTALIREARDLPFLMIERQPISISVTSSSTPS